MYIRKTISQIAVIVAVLFCAAGLWSEVVDPDTGAGAAAEVTGGKKLSAES
jgi:hypothetical protein